MAYPIGGPGNARFLVMEIHYDNPDMQSGMLFKFLRTNKDKTISNIRAEGQLVPENLSHILAFTC